MKILNMAIMGLTMLLVVTTVFAHEFSAPATVTADGDGYFSYEVTIVITSATEFAFAEADGSDNTDIGHWIADGFCMVLIEPGVYMETVAGSLLDPFTSGSVIYTHAMCDGWTGAGTTTILPPSVATTPMSWSGLKALYR